MTLLIASFNSLYGTGLSALGFSVLCRGRIYPTRNTGLDESSPYIWDCRTLCGRSQWHYCLLFPSLCHCEECSDAAIPSTTIGQASRLPKMSFPVFNQITNLLNHKKNFLYHVFYLFLICFWFIFYLFLSELIYVNLKIKKSEQLFLSFGFSSEFIRI